MDVSLYVEGWSRSWQGTLAGDVKLQSTQKTAFNRVQRALCAVSHKGMPAPPATAMESINSMAGST